jgi:hypothetical protein
MIQRLMADSAVDHGYASLLTDEVMAGRHSRSTLGSPF